MKAALVMAALLASGWVIGIAQEQSADHESTEAEHRTRIKSIAKQCESFHNEIHEILSQKEQKERSIRDAIPGIPTEQVTHEEVAEYHFALQAFQEWHSRGSGVASDLCAHLEAKPVPVAGRATRATYVELFPAAQTLVMMDPRTAKVIVRNAWRYETPKMQFLVGAMLNELDGFELAKARLDIAIHELPQDHTLGEALKSKATKNLQAIRKLYDKKDAFEAKRK
ncbi:MAG: hypothetical protein ACO1RA_17165 [Planctomycetaceae bacterium]